MFDPRTFESISGSLIKCDRTNKIEAFQTLSIPDNWRKNIYIDRFSDLSISVLLELQLIAIVIDAI